MVLLTLRPEVLLTLRPEVLLTLRPEVLLTLRPEVLLTLRAEVLLTLLVEVSTLTGFVTLERPFSKFFTKTVFNILLEAFCTSFF